jgi:hypothetical protein
MSVYPKNGVPIHKLNNFEKRNYKSPIKRFNLILDDIKLLPDKLNLYFRTSANLVTVDFISERDKPKLYNILSFYNSRITGLINMINLLNRTWKLNSRESIQELTRNMKILISGLNKVVHYFNESADKVLDHPNIRDGIKSMVGYTRTLEDSVKKILAIKGVQY